MIDDIKLEQNIRLRINNFNKRQEELHFHSYILKFALFVVFLILLVIFSLIAASFLNPLFLPGKNPTTDAISMMFSGCMISVVVVGAALYYFVNYGKKKQTQKEQYINELASLQKTVDSDNSIVKGPTEDVSLNIQKEMHKINKQNRVSRFFSIFSMINSLLSMFFGLFFAPVKPKEVIYFDRTKMDFSIDLVKTLIDQKNYVIDFETIRSKDPNCSNTWYNNTLSSLEKLQVIKTNFDDTRKKFILLDLDFYNPEFD